MTVIIIATGNNQPNHPYTNTTKDRKAPANAGKIVKSYNGQKIRGNKPRKRTTKINTNKGNDNYTAWGS